MSLTLPQMVMLNHKAWLEQKKFEKDIGKKTPVDEVNIAHDNPVVFNGKTMDEMTSSEWNVYYGGFGVE